MRDLVVSCWIERKGEGAGVSVVRKDKKKQQKRENRRIEVRRVISWGGGAIRSMEQERKNKVGHQQLRSTKIKYEEFIFL